MRFFYLFAIVCCLASCKTRKETNSINSAKETIPNTTKTRDSIFEFVETAEQQKDSTKTQGFHQNLTKRTLEPHELWNEILQKHVSKNGDVNYREIQKDHKDFYGYIHILSLIAQHQNFNSFSRDQKLAFWINAYNAFTVDLILRHYPVKSIKNIKNPWKQRHWKLGNKWYNLDEIEHKILRKMDEPRIHFAINCASVSCPKLQNKAFTSQNLEEQLTKATKAFLNDSSKNILSKNSMTLSKLFQWFDKDFKKHGTLIGFINQYSEVQISNKAKKSFMNYNWDLNE